MSPLNLIQKEGKLLEKNVIKTQKIRKMYLCQVIFQLIFSIDIYLAISQKVKRNYGLILMKILLVKRGSCNLIFYHFLLNNLSKQINKFRLVVIIIIYHDMKK